MPLLDATPKEAERASPEAELEALAEASRLVGSAVAVSDGLRSQLAVLHELTRSRTSFIALHDSSRRLLTVACSRGRSDPRVKACAVDEGSLGRAFSEQAVVVEQGGSPLLCLGLSRGGAPAGVVCLLGPKVWPSPQALGGLAASFSAAMEVTQLREELRQRSEALAEASTQVKSFDRQRDEFLGRVSHELKTPLTTVKTYLSLLLRGRMGPVVAEQHRALAVCDRNSDRLLRLIDDLLLTSRLSVAQMNLGDKPFGLKALLEECWGLQAKAAAHARVTLEPVQGGERFVRGDREHLREALGVVLDNAVRYNAPGGRVWARLSGAGATALVEVGDSGPGLSPERLSTLFEPFAVRPDLGARRHQPTSGLARANQILALHGGSLSARSQPGEGSVFSLSLPLFAGMVASAQPENPPVRRSGAVLLVEDDDDCREGVAELLVAEGMSVDAVGSVAEAVAALDTGRPALLLVDLRLRGDDGRTVIAHVRNSPALREVPVFVMSGAVSEASGLSTEGPERIDGFFEKPLNLPRLLARIREVVQQDAEK